MMRKITLGSDLHLEFGRGDLEFPGGDILVLAGDVCVASHFRPEGPYGTNRLFPSKLEKRYKKFFDDVSKKYNEIVYVFGNHEHYHGDLATSKEILSKVVEEHKNIHILENETFSVDDIVFVGATLWTDLNRDDWFVKHAVLDLMNDFVVIADNHKKFGPMSWMNLHKFSLAFIRKAAYENQDKKVVVVSHHGPTTESIASEYKAQMRLDNWAYVSDLSETILDNPNIRYWMHGHVHSRRDYMVGDTRVLCNPRGYFGKQNQLVNSFNTDLTVDL